MKKKQETINVGDEDRGDILMRVLEEKLSECCGARVWDEGYMYGRCSDCREHA